MVPAIAVAAFFLLLNTSPLNAALINSVGAQIRATAIAVKYLHHSHSRRRPLSNNDGLRGG